MKSSRDNILAAIANHKPAYTPIPENEIPAQVNGTLVELFSQTAVGIGCRFFQVEGYQEIEKILQQEFKEAKRIISRVKSLSFPPDVPAQQPDQGPHSLENVDLAVLEGQLAVAENGATWLSEKEMGQRVLPFICQHLVLVISEKTIVATMHEAYDRLGRMTEGYGTFIAGPSKTADIEQSLVLGAHGPRSLTIFCLQEKIN